YLTWVMSKFMGLGFSLEQVITMATTAPAKVINRIPKLGTLQVGAPGDVAIMELIEGSVSFVDTRNNRREGKAYLKPVQTVTAGVPFGRPYNSPFAVRCSTERDSGHPFDGRIPAIRAWLTRATEVSSPHPVF